MTDRKKLFIMEMSKYFYFTSKLIDSPLVDKFIDGTDRYGLFVWCLGRKRENAQEAGITNILNSIETKVFDKQLKYDKVDERVVEFFS